MTKVNRTDVYTEAPVNDEGLEQAVLSLLMWSTNPKEHIYHLNEDDFYKPIHKKIFKLLFKYIDSHEAYTYEELPIKFKTNEDVMIIRGITVLNCFATSHIAKLKEIAGRRAFQHLTTDINVMAKEERDIHVIRTKIEDTISTVSNNMLSVYSTQNKDVENDFMKLLATEHETMDVGFYRLDNEIGGLCPGYFVVIGGIPGVGKTTYMLNMMNHICQQGKKVLFVSLEMPYVETHAKLVSELSGMPLRIARGVDPNLDYTKIIDAVAKISDYKLFRMGERGATVSDIEYNINKLDGVDVVFVDYLQRLIPSNGSSSRYEQVSNMARDLKMMANKFKIPVVCVASINRGYEARTDHRPRLADFRDSGNIEYDVDVGLILHRPTMFPDPSIDNATYIDMFDVVEVQVVKNRYGSTGTIIKYDFKGAESKFIERIV